MPTILMMGTLHQSHPGGPYANVVWFVGSQSSWTRLASKLRGDYHTFSSPRRRFPVMTSNSVLSFAHQSSGGISCCQEKTQTRKLASAIPGSRCQFCDLEEVFFALSVVNQPSVPLQILNALVENGDAKLKSMSSFHPLSLLLPLEIYFDFLPPHSVSNSALVI